MVGVGLRADELSWGLHRGDSSASVGRDAFSEEVSWARERNYLLIWDRKGEVHRVRLSTESVRGLAATLPHLEGAADFDVMARFADIDKGPGAELLRRLSEEE